MPDPPGEESGGAGGQRAERRLRAVEEPQHVAEPQDPRASAAEARELAEQVGSAAEEARRESVAELTEQVRKLSDSDLESPVANWQPSDPTTPQGLLRGWIMVITAEHDREHHHWMREVLAQGVADGAFRTPYATDAARTILGAVAAIASWYRPDGALGRGQLAEQYARYALALLEAPLTH